MQKRLKGWIKMSKVEILAPAGSYESLKGAINGGCDAVYLGGVKFGARAFANNLDEDTMLRAIDYVHLHQKKIYLTVNTLLHNEEIQEELFEYLSKYYRQGLDALIVQDLGVLSFVQRNFPKLPIHASTQMTFQSEKGAKLLKDHGVTRFVTARELGIEELKKIRKYTDLEIETFVHGALCYCYSGQCFFSSMIGDRSGNRGRCAQPCRMPYTVKEESGKTRNAPPYILSPKDMCTLDRIPDLVDAGIDSFKIEGRMKKPEYAAYTAYLYRKYTDLYLEYGEGYYNYLKKHKAQLEEDYTGLMDLYNRGGFSTGYFYDYNGEKIMSMDRPNHSGVRIGTVTGMKKNRAYIKLEQDIYAQDVLEFRGKNGDCLYEYTVKEGALVLKEGKTETNTKPNAGITVGDPVYRTRRNALLDKIQKEILEKNRKISIDMYFTALVGSEMELTVVAGEYSVSVKGDLTEGANNQPITEEKIIKQLGKLNDTHFYLQECNVYMEEAVFIPIGKLNDLRRRAIEEITTQICSSYYREAVQLNTGTEKLIQSESKTASSFVVMVTKPEQAKVALKYSEIENIYYDLGALNEEDVLEIIEENNKPAYLVLPAILRRKDYEIYEKAMAKSFKNKGEETVLSKLIGHEKIKGYVIKNFEAYALYENYVKNNTKKECILDYNMYTFNQEAKSFWKKKGVNYTTASIELNGYQWRINGCENQDIIVYGHLPLMTSVQCIEKNTKSCSKNMRKLIFVDKFKKEFYAINRCKYCYNQIYDGLPLSLHEYMEELEELKPRHYRLDFVTESAERTEEIILFYLGAKNKKSECPIKEFTTGHYRKGVR